MKLTIIFAALILVFNNFTKAQVVSFSENNSNYMSSEAAGLDNIHELVNGNIVKVVQTNRTVSSTYYKEFSILVLTPSGVVLSSQAFQYYYNTINDFISLSVRSTTVDNNGNLYVGVLLNSYGTSIGTLVSSTVIFKFDFNQLTNSYTNASWTAISGHFNHISGVFNRYPTNIKLKYMPSINKLVSVVTVGTFGTINPTIHDYQQIVINLIDINTGYSNPLTQNVIALTDTYGSDFFNVTTIGNFYGDIFIAGEYKKYLNLPSTLTLNFMSGFIIVDHTNLSHISHTAVRHHNTFTSGAGSPSVIKWLSHANKFAVGFHGLNANIGICFIDDSFSPTNSAEYIVPSFLEIYPFDIDYNQYFDVAEISCMSHSGIGFSLGRINVSPSNYSHNDFWAAETSNWPDGALFLNAGGAPRYISTSMSSTGLNFHVEYDFCSYGQQFPPSVVNYNPTSYGFNYVESYNSSYIGGNRLDVVSYFSSNTNLILSNALGTSNYCNVGTNQFSPYQSYKTETINQSLSVTDKHIKTMVFNILGGNVFSTEVNSSINVLINKLETLNLPAGIYVIRSVYKNNQIRSEKVFLK